METLPSVRDDDGQGRAEPDQRPSRQDANAGDGRGLCGSDDGNGDDGKGRCADVLSALEEAHRAEQSFLAERRGQEAGQAIAPDTEAWVRDSDGLLADKLDTVGEKALDWCNEILTLPLPAKDDEAFGTIARAKGVAAQTGLNTLMRVNEIRLKRQALGKLPELLKRIQEEREKIKTIERT